MPTKDFAKRVRQAWRHAEDKQDFRRISQAEFAQLVSDQLKREKPLSQTAVSRWLRGAIPDVDVIEAIAAVCGVRPAWLAWNEPPMVAPPPAVLGVPQLPRDDMHERTALTSAEAERLKLQQEQTAARARRRVAGEGSRRRGTG